MPAPTTRDGASLQLAPGVEHRPVVLPDLTADLITICRDPHGRPANKVIDFAEESWTKQAAGAKGAAYVAHTVAVGDPEAFAAVQRGLGADEFLLLAWVPGTEDGQPFRIVAERALASRLGMPERSFPLGLYRVPQTDPLWSVGRFKENFQFSTWVPFDADAHPEMPAGLRWKTPEEWWDRMTSAGLLPAEARRVAVRSNSSRVEAGGSPVFGGTSCRTYVQSEPSRRTPRSWERAFMVQAHAAGLGWLKSAHSTSTGAVVSCTPASIFDPVVLRSPVQPEFDGPPSLGPGALEVGATVVPAQVTVAGSSRWDTTTVQADAERLDAFSRATGIKATLHGSADSLRVAWVREDLSLELQVQTEAGPMTVDAFWRSTHTRLRAQVPAEFRDSASDNAYLGRHKDGVPFLFDNGPGEKHILPPAVREERQERIAWDTIEGLPLAERRVRWPDLAAPLPPEAQTRILGRLAEMDEMEAGVADLRRRLKPAADAFRAEEEAERIAVSVAAHAAGRLQVRYEEIRLAEVAREVAAEMVRHPAGFPVFVRTGERGPEFVYVTKRELPFTHGLGSDKPPPVLSINLLGHATLIEKLEPVVQLVGEGKHGPVLLPLKTEVRLQVLGMEDKPGQKILGVTGHPLVLADGTIVAREGLDPALGIYFDFGGVDFGEVRPLSKDEAAEARLRVREVMLSGSFPASDLDAEVLALALPLTGLLRRVVEGAPFGLLTASTPKCGKTKAAVRLGTIITGHSPPLTRWPSTDDEMEKRVGAILRHGAEILIFDNVENGLTLRSAFLAQLATGNTTNLRILGEMTSEVVASPFLVVTGNNLGLAQDEVSRYLECRLALPPEGHQYEHDAVPHAKRHRVEVVRLLLGIVAGYLKSGERIAAPSRYQDRAGWDRMVRQPILWAGGLDVAGVLARNEEQSEELHARDEVIRELRERFGAGTFSGGDLARSVDFGTPRLRDALESLRADTRSARSVGWALAGLKDNVSTDRKWVLKKVGPRGYRVEPVGADPEMERLLS